MQSGKVGQQITFNLFLKFGLIVVKTNNKIDHLTHV